MIRLSVSRTLLAAAVLGTPVVLGAQSKDNTPYGTSSGEFLELSPTARGLALGGTYSALATELGALSRNPGALALLRRPGAAFAQTSYIADTHLNWGGIAAPFGGGANAIGAQIGSFGFKDQPVYTPGRPDEGVSYYSVSETYMALSVARNFSNRFSVGITGKGVFDQLGQVSGSAFAIDFGTHFHSTLGGRPTQFAFTLTNLGTNLSYDGQPLQRYLPRNVVPDSIAGDGTLPTNPIAVTYRNTAFSLPVKFSVSLTHDFIATENTRLTIGGQFDQARSDKARYGGAAELAVDRVGGSPFGLAVRGSYTASPSLTYETASYTSDAKEKNAGLAAGFGVSYATRGGFTLGVDYGWKSMGLLGDVNTFSVSVGW